MPIIDVYKGRKKIASKKFRSQFMIITTEDKYGFRWAADEETGSGVGGILVWILATHPPDIHFIPPGWELFIDGVAVIDKDSKASERFDIEVHGRVAEIRRDDFKFICEF